MFLFENLRLITDFNFFYFVIGVFVLAFLSYFYYKQTLPPISAWLRITLILLRFTVLVFILFLIFNPKITYETKIKVKPKIACFFDNSSSLVTFDSSNTAQSIFQFTNDLQKNADVQFSYYSFSDSVKKIKDVSTSLSFTGKRTNLNNAIKKIISIEDSISAVILVTDGIITEGENPIPKLKELTIPVHILAVGKQKKYPDVEIKKISLPAFAYKNYKTPVTVTIYANQNVKSETVTTLNFTLNGKPYGRKKIKLNPGSVIKTSFDFIPQKTGKIILSFKIPPQKNEKNKINNIKSATTEVLEKKKNILIVTDSPIYDVTFLRQALLSDTNFTVSKLLIFPNSKSPALNDEKEKIKKSNAIFFVSYPTKNTNTKIFNLLRKTVSEGKPYFYEFSATTDIKNFEKLTGLKLLSPRNKIQFVSAQPVITDKSAPFWEDIQNTNEIIRNLPPVSVAFINQSFPRYYKTLLTSQINGAITSSSIAIYGTTENSSSVIFFATDLWKWKLQNPLPASFDKFFVNIAQWLTNNKKEKLFFVSTDKKQYSQLEKIRITARLYDELLKPVTNANVKFTITNGSFRKEVFLTINNLNEYESEISTLTPGQYRITAESNFNGKHFTATTFISVTSVDVEKATAGRNNYLLHKIATETSGKVFEITNSKSLIENILKAKKKFKRKKNIFIFFPLQKILFFIILLLSIEWLLRKLKGLL